MSEESWSAIKRAVYARANGCVEYCRSCEDNTGQTMEVEHIDPNGGDILENLCLSCGNCNRSKGIATTSFDPETETPVQLFNPRKQIWSEHFMWTDGGKQLLGTTPTGRATVVRFKMNRDHMIRARHRWIVAGFHPPAEN